jgi:hypothetical protein
VRFHLELKIEINKKIYYEFSEFLLNCGFEFHLKEFKKYIRSNRTTHILIDDKIITKGTYKIMPIMLRKAFEDVILELNPDLRPLTKIYSKKFFEISRQNNIRDILENYYICNENKVLDSSGKYTLFRHNTDIDPHLYIKTFLYPGILMSKLENK